VTSCGVAAGAPLLDGGLVDGGFVAGGLVFGLDDGDVLVLGAGEVLDEADDTVACGDAELAHDELGLGGTVFLPGTPGGELVVRGLGVLEGVVDGVVEGVVVGLPLSLGVGLPLVLLAPGEAPPLELVALPPLAGLLDEVTGGDVVRVGVPVVADVTDGLEDGGAQGLVVTGPAALAALLGVPAPGEGVGEMVPSPSVMAEPLGVLLLKAWLTSWPTEIVHWRAGGTADRTTPTANTVKPTAKAGRSIASRQSLDRCGDGRRGGRRCGWPRPAGPPRRTRLASLAAKPAAASQSPSAPLGAVGRDRIFSRMRSRPSVPGST
jgi:hypothetical protein